MKPLNAEEVSWAKRTKPTNYDDLFIDETDNDAPQTCSVKGCSAPIWPGAYHSGSPVCLRCYEELNGETADFHVGFAGRVALTVIAFLSMLDGIIATSFGQFLLLGVVVLGIGFATYESLRPHGIE